MSAVTRTASPPSPATGGPEDPETFNRLLLEGSDEELFRRMRTAQPAACSRIRERLVIRHGGLVRWLAAQYASQVVEVEELRQVGYLGLVLAIDRFDVERGSEFISYARPTVQGEIRRWFRDKRRWIRLPRRLQEAKATLKGAGEILTHRLGREPTVAELAEQCGLARETVAEALAADDNFTTASLNAPVGSDGDESFSLAEMIGAPEPAMDLMVDCTALRPLLEQLDERDRRLLQLRFYDELTQVEIGRELGCSQMHVSRLLARVLTQLREGMLEQAEPTAEAAPQPVAA